MMNRSSDDTTEFIETHCRHTKGKWANQLFNLRPWQKEIIRGIFGPKDKEGNRTVRTAYVEVPRKNGKSELAAAVALKLLFSDGEEGAEIYSAAADRDQASLVFNVAAQMVRKDPVLNRNCKVHDSTKRIVREDKGSFYRAIAADAAGSHGFNAHGIIFDEVHTQKNRDLWDVLTSSTGAREQPLIFAITTAGYDRQSICWELHEYASRVLSGTVVDPTFYAYIKAAPEDADWTDEKVWHECNPALGDFRSIDQLRMECQRAKEMPAAQNTFRRLYLNQWTQQSDRWIDLSLWDEQAGIVPPESKLHGMTAYGGLDLSSVRDLTAWVLVIPDGDKIKVLPRFWCPESWTTDPANRYRENYQMWAQKGFLNVTKGNAVDYEAVVNQVVEDCRRFKIPRIHIDRLFQGAQVEMTLNDHLGEGVVFPFGQTFMSYAMPMKSTEAMLLEHRVTHGGHPVMRFCIDNVAVKQDAAGNLKPDKATKNPIDGFVGLVMAIGAKELCENNASVYEGRGLRSV